MWKIFLIGIYSPVGMFIRHLRVVCVHVCLWVGWGGGGERDYFNVKLHMQLFYGTSLRNNIKTRLHKSRSSRDELEFDLSNFV